jgi:hypothetical protein
LTAASRRFLRVQAADPQIEDLGFNVATVDGFILRKFKTMPDEH